MSDKFTVFNNARSTDNLFQNILCDGRQYLQHACIHIHTHLYACFLLNCNIAGWYQNHHSVASALIVFVMHVSKPVDMKVTLTPYTPYPTLSPAQTLYLHETCQNKPKSEVCQPATSPLDIRVASSSAVFIIHAASWHEIYTHTRVRLFASQNVTSIQNCNIYM